MVKYPSPISIQFSDDQPPSPRHPSRSQFGQGRERTKADLPPGSSGGGLCSAAITGDASQHPNGVIHWSHHEKNMSLKKKKNYLYVWPSF